MKEWWKKNWYWVVFPVGLVVLFLRFWFPRPIRLLPEAKEDDITPVDNISATVREKEKALAEIEGRYQDKIRALSDEQLKEWEDMKSKPIDEVAQWIDKL